MILSDKICLPHHTRSLFRRGPTPCFKGVKSLKEQNICSTKNLLQSSIDSIPYGIQSSSQMIAGSNHLWNTYYLGSNYHSQSQVIGSLKCIKFRVYKLGKIPFVRLILHLDWSYRNPERFLQFFRFVAPSTKHDLLASWNARKKTPGVTRTFI